MTPDLSPDERATVERIEAAPAAEESLRERVAVAIFAAHDCGVPWERLIDEDKDSHRHLADAAIATMRGES